MPGNLRKFKINQGMHIEGNGSTLDLIIRGIQGTQRYKEGDLEIVENGISKIIHISHEDPMLEIIPGVNVQIAGSGTKVSSKKIVLSYFLKTNYRFYFRSYQ